ncbi:MAG: DHA2 family efflux MFS transporter permease subunit [Limosilactobacillus sp.]|uniref:DHA2 family efflux MFS transporter permease subunit n=1 Tax=Limosilactobacillus sp. TaxID=2773925 RepID=UPI00270ECF0D|nr:DHA2 family efflux MFS transporter permease subunit [Limosilactobacillus sp.]
MNETPQARQPIRHPKLAMVSLLMGAFIGMFSETAMNIALPNLMASLHIDTSSAQWLVTGYMLVIGIVLPLSSLISKCFTTRQVICFALIDFIVGAIISASASTFPVLLAGRMIQGVGTGLILPLMFAVVMQVFPPQKIGAVMGICALVIMFATAIGPTLTGLVLAKLSWHWVFWLFVPVLLVALIFAFTSLVNIGKVTRPRIDILSILESMIGFSGLVVGASLASEHGWMSTPVICSLLIGLVVLICYVHRQLTIEEPILNLKIFKNRAFTIGACIVMIDFGIILSAVYILPLYIQKGLLLPVALTGIILLPGGVVNALTSAISGRMYDSVGAKKPVMIGFAIALIGALMLAFGSTHSPVAYIIAAHVVLMIGCPLAMSPAQTSALNSLAGLESGDGSTILNAMQQVVGALVTALATSFLELGRSLGTGSGAERFTHGAHFGFYFTIILILIGLVLSLQIGEKSKNH